MKTVSGLMLVLALVLALVVSTAPGLAQQYPLRLFNEEQGLNSLSVTAIHQSQAGFVWLGSMSGLHRFDGAEFREFRTEDAAMWYVMDIMEDRNGTIWLAGGLGLYRIEGNLAVRVLDTGFPSNGGFISLYEAPDGNIWFGTSESGAGLLVDESPVYMDFIPQESIYRFLTHPEGGMLFAGSSGLYHRPEGSDSVNVVLGQAEVRDMLFDESGRLWVGTYSGLYVLEDGDIIHHFHTGNGLPSNEVRMLNSGHDGIVYAATDGGLAEVYPDFRVNVFGQNEGLINQQLQAIETDLEGNLLLGTSYSGLYMLYNRHFTHFPLTGPEKQTRVTSITGDATGNIWMTTWSDGVIVLDSSLQVSKEIGTDAGLPDDRITSVVPFSDGSAFIGTRMHGLHLYRNGQVARVENSPQPLGNYILSMMRTSDGTIWISSHTEGIFHYRDGSFTQPFRGTALDGKIVASMHEDTESGNIWLSLRNGGVARISGSSPHIYGRDQGLPDELVFTSETDAEGNLWIAHHSGLSIFDGEAFSTPGEDNPLEGEFILSVLRDTEGRMWKGLTRGLISYSDGNFNRYTREDGLVSDRFEDASAYRDPNGYLWFGTYNGAVRISPNIAEPDRRPPPVVIDRVYQMNRRVEDFSRIEAPYNENFIRIGLRGISYTTPGKVRYRYRLAGGDAGWFETTQPEVQLASLSPGSYRFEAQASTDGISWSTNPALLNLVIRAPFWQTWWFRLLVVCLVIAIGWTVYRYRVKRLLEMERLRTRIATDLHDDVGSTLTRISLYSELVARQPNPEKNNRYIESISSLSRSLLTTMSDIVWSIDARSDSWGDLVSRMQEYAGNTLQAADIKLNLEFSGIDEDAGIPVDLRQNLYLIFKEAVNNAARHSGASEVSAGLSCSSQRIELWVSDNGIGIKKEKHRGNGLRNMQLRAERIGGQLSVASDENGCRITLIRKP